MKSFYSFGNFFPSLKFKRKIFKKEENGDKAWEVIRGIT